MALRPMCPWHDPKATGIASEVIQCITITAAGHRITDTRAHRLLQQTFPRSAKIRESEQLGMIKTNVILCLLFRQFYCFFVVVTYLFQIKHAGVGLRKHHLALSRLNTCKEKWVIIMWFGYSALSDGPANLIHTHTPNKGSAGSRSITPLCPAQLGQHTPQTTALTGTAELLPAQFSLINSGLHNTQLPCLLHSSLVGQDVFQLIRPTSLFSQTHWSILPASQGQSRRCGFLNVLNNHSVMDLSQVPRLTKQLPGLLFAHLLRYTSSNRKRIFICLFLVMFSRVLGLAGEVSSARESLDLLLDELQESHQHVTSGKCHLSRVSLQWQRLITHYKCTSKSKTSKSTEGILMVSLALMGQLAEYFVLLFSGVSQQKRGLDILCLGEQRTTELV